MKKANDTVSILIGRIGKENLSKTATKKLASLNEAHEQLFNLETAFEESDDKDKTKYKREVDKKKETIEIIEADFLAFLQDEEDDVIKRQAELEEKEKARQEKEEEARLAKEEALRLKKEKEDREAEEEEQARLAKEEEDRLAEEAEAERLKKEALEKKKNPNSNEKDEKPKSLVGAVIGGIAVVAGIFFGINYFKNK